LFNLNIRSNPIDGKIGKIDLSMVNCPRSIADSMQQQV